MLCKIYLFPCMFCKIYILHCVKELFISSHVVQNLYILLHAVWIYKVNFFVCYAKFIYSIAWCANSTVQYVYAPLHVFPLHVSRNIYILQYCMLYLFRFLFFIAFMRNDLSLRLKEHQNIIFLFIPLHFVNIVSVGRVLVAVLVVVIGGGGWLFVGLATRLPLPIRGCERGSVGDEIGLPPPSPHTTHWIWPEGQRTFRRRAKKNIDMVDDVMACR